MFPYIYILLRKIHCNIYRLIFELMSVSTFCCVYNGASYLLNKCSGSCKTTGKVKLHFTKTVDNVLVTDSRKLQRAK